jgi:integrase
MLSGARRTAIVTLLWSKVDLRKGTAAVHTKGDVWHEFPMSHRMKEIIANRPKVGPYVFTYECERPAPPREGRARRIKGERYPFSKDGWKRKWYKALADAGVTDFRFHDLRHTAATRITRASNLKVAQKLLGHSRIETTARYAHVGDDDIRRAMEDVQQSRNSPEQVGGGIQKNPEKPYIRRVK